MFRSPADNANNLYKDAGEKLFREQIDNLYHLLEKDDLLPANKLIEQIGDSMNLLALEPLIILLEHPDETVRGNSALALGKIGSKTSIQYLVKALNDPSEKVKISVVTALGMFGDKSVIRTLESIPLSPEEPKLTNAVRNAVFKIDHSDSLDKISRETASADDEQQIAVDIPTPVSYLQGEIPIINQISEMEEKQPVIAAICSFFIPGLGQVYNGESYVKGFMYLAATYIGFLLILPGFILWLYGIYNAYTTANKINAGEIMTNPSSTGRVLIYGVAAFLIPIILTIVLAVIIAAFVFSSAGGNVQTTHFPEFTAYRINDTAIRFDLVNMGGATSVNGFNVTQPMMTNPTILDPYATLTPGQRIIINDSSFSGTAHITASSMVDGKRQVVIDTYV